MTATELEWEVNERNLRFATTSWRLSDFGKGDDDLQLGGNI